MMSNSQQMDIIKLPEKMVPDGIQRLREVGVWNGEIFVNA